MPGRSAVRMTASFSPAEARVAAGGTTTVGVVAMGVQDLTGVELVVTWDPAVVEATDASPGSLLTLDGERVAAERSLETGRARVRFTRAAGTAGSGVVASIGFRGRKVGATALRVEQLNLTAGGQTSTIAVTPGRVTVSP